MLCSAKVVTASGDGKAKTLTLDVKWKILLYLSEPLYCIPPPWIWFCTKDLTLQRRAKQGFWWSNFRVSTRRNFAIHCCRQRPGVLWQDGAFQCFSCALWELLVIRCNKLIPWILRQALVDAVWPRGLAGFLPPPWQFKASANKIWHATKAAGTRSRTRWKFLQIKFSTI